MPQKTSTPPVDEVIPCRIAGMTLKRDWAGFIRDHVDAKLGTRPPGKGWDWITVYCPLCRYLTLHAARARKDGEILCICSARGCRMDCRGVDPE
jgi:hypothetical protein